MELLTHVDLWIGFALGILASGILRRVLRNLI
jgi:hypothetical protein